MAKKVVCEGEVIVRDGQNSAIEFYTEEFVLDGAVKTEGQARSMIQGGLITERLRRKVDNFKRVRTCAIVDFAETSDEAEHSELDKLLLRATELDCLPENIDNYKRPDYKVKALQQAVERAEQRNKAKKKDNVQDLGYVD